MRALRKRRRAPVRPVRCALLGAAALFAAAGAAEPVYAQRGGGGGGVSVNQVVSGDVSMRRTRGGLTINASDGAIIEFDRFSIPKRGFLRFNQPGAEASVLNRVVGPEASLIQGTLVANGQVFLVNPNGVTFGPGARVNVAALFAAGGNISNTDFRRGIHRFTNLTGSVVNQGAINADGGAHLAGSSVSNTGSIVSSRGVVSLSAGDNVYLAERGSSVMVRIDAPGATSASPAPAPDDGVGVRNEGSVSGREVLFSTGDVYSLAIRNSGEVRSEGGSIAVNSAGEARNSGSLDASDRSAGGVGGEVRLLGSRVVQEGVIDASGDAGGGTALVGGGFRGEGTDRRAATTIITPDSVIRADAITRGEGGRVAVWGTRGAFVGGEITARGGEFDGSGGFIETSAGSLLLDARIDAGVGGEFLIDPVDLTIGGGPAAPFDPDDFDFDGAVSSVSAATVQAALDAGSAIILEAQNSVTVNTSINSAGGGDGSDLTLRAGKDIIVTNNTTIATDGDIVLEANFYEDGPSDLNELIAAGRTAGDATITLGNQVDIIAGGEARIEVRAEATPLGSGNGPGGSDIPVDVDTNTPAVDPFSVGDIALGSPANNAQRASITGDSVVVIVPNGLTTNADITGTNPDSFVTLHAGADGTGTHAFDGANTVTLDSPNITLRAGDGTGTATISFAANAPELANVSTLTIRQDGDIDSTQLLAESEIGPGLPGLDYTLQSDAGAIALGDRTNLIDADLTLRAAGDVTLGANAGGPGLGDVVIIADADSDGAGDVSIGSAVTLGDRSLVSEGVGFTNTAAGTITSTTGDITLDHTGAVALNGAISGAGVSATTTDAVAVGANLTGSNSVALRAEGGVAFSAPGAIIAAPAVELRATGGASIVDFSVNAPLVRGAGAAAPDAFVHEQGPAMSEADLLAGANFDQGAPAAYTLQSGASIAINDATPLQNTDLTLLAGDGVTLSGAVAYTLDGLTIDADTDTDLAGDTTISQAVTVAGGTIDSRGANFTSAAGFDLTADAISFDHTGDVSLTNPGQRLTLGDAVVGGSMTLDVTNGAGTTALDQAAGTTLVVAGALDITTAGAVSAIDLSSADAGSVAITTPGDATIVSPGSLAFGASTIGGALDATASDGDATFGGAVDVTGAATVRAQGASSDLLAGANLTGSTDVALEAGSDIAFTRAGGLIISADAGRDATLDLAGPTTLTLTTGGDAQVNAGGALSLAASTIGGGLTIDATAQVTSGATVDVAGDASITSNTGVVAPFAIVFSDLRVDGTLSLQTDGVADVGTTSGGFTIGDSSVGVALRLIAPGAIDGAGALEVGKGALVIPGALTQLEAGSVNLIGLDSAVPILLDVAGDATITNAGAAALEPSIVGGSLQVTALSGSITDIGAVTVGADAAFLAEGAGGSITLDGAAVAGETTLRSSGGVGFTSSGDVRIAAFSAGADSTIEAPDIDLSGGAGTVEASAAGVNLALLPSSGALSIGIGDGFGADGQDFTLSSGDLAALADGFASITIGRSDVFTNTLILGGGVAVSDPVVFRRPTDGVQTTTVSDGVAGSGDASITFLGAAGGGFDLAGDITTQGGAIALNDGAALLGDASLRSAGGNITAGSISSAAPGVGSLTIDAGSTGVATLGDLGAGSALASFDLVDASAATLGAVTATGEVDLAAESLTTGALTSANNLAVSITADSLTLGGAVTTTGDLLVQTRSPGRDIGLNTAAGGLDLDGATFTNLFVGAGRNSVTVGRADATGRIVVGDLGGAVVANLGSDTVIRAPGGEIVINERLHALGDASIELTAPTVRVRRSVFTDNGDLTITGRTLLEGVDPDFSSTQIGALNPGVVAPTITVGAVDAAAGESVLIGHNGDGVVVLTGDIGLSGALGDLTLFTPQTRLASSVAMDVSSVGFTGAVDSAAGQTHALTITSATGAQFTGRVGALDALASLDVLGPASIGADLVRATGAMSFDGAVALTSDAVFEGASVSMEGGLAAAGRNVTLDAADASLSGGVFNAGTLTLTGEGVITGASVDADALGVQGDATLTDAIINANGVVLSGAAALTDSTITAALSTIAGDATVRGDVAFSGGDVRFEGAVDGAGAGTGALTLNSTSRFEGRVGDGARLASLTANGDASVATDLLDAGAVEFNGALTIDAPALRVRGNTAEFAAVDSAGAGGALTITSGASRFTGLVGAVNPLASLEVQGGATLAPGASAITTAGAQRYMGAVAMETGATMQSVSGGDLTFESTIDGPFSLDLTTSGLTTFGGRVGAGDQLTSLTSAGAARIETDAIAAGTVELLGDVTLANPGVLVSGGDVRFGAGVASAGGQGNGLTVTASGATRFDGAVGAGAGALGALISDGGGTTILNAGSVNADSATFADAVQIDNPSVTITGSTIRFNGALSSVGGESNALTVDAGAGTARFGAGASNLSSLTANAQTTFLGGPVAGVGTLTTDAAGGTTIASSTIGVGQANFNDAVTLAAPTVTITGDAARFFSGVSSQTAGGSSLTVNAGTTLFAGAIGAGGRLNSLTTDAAGATTINGALARAETITLNDLVLLGGPALTIDANTVTLAAMDADAGASPDLTINAQALTLNGDLGAGAALGSLTTDAAGATSVNGAVITTGAQTYNDPVALAGSLDGSGVTFAGDVQVGAGAAVNAAGEAAFLGEVGGAGSLRVSASTAMFARAIGAVNILGSLEVNADTTLSEGLVVTSGAQTFNGTLRLASDTTFNGQDVSIIGTLRSTDGAQERLVVINDAGETLLEGDLADLSELRTDGAGLTRLSGDFLVGDALFGDDVVLVGDARIESTGDAGISFLGTIDSDSLDTARSLTLQTDRAAIEGLDADAIRERLLEEGRPLPTISFGADIGAAAPLADLRLNAEGNRLDPAVYATIVGVRRQDNGRISITTPLNMTINADRFEMGRNEKFTVLGGLTLNAGAEAILGDVTTANAMRINVSDAGRIVLLVRDIGELLAPAEDAEDVLGLVDGSEVLDRVDLVAGGQVILSKAPELLGMLDGEPVKAVVSGSGASSGNTQTSRDVLFRIFPRTPIALEELVLRLDGDGLFDPGAPGGGPPPLLFGPTVIDVVLDITSDGLTLADTSGLEGVSGLTAETAAGAIEDQVLLSQSVRDRLERVGVNARDPMMNELVQALGGRAVYNDYSVEATASDNIGQYPGEIVVNRLPRAAAARLVAQFDALVGADDAKLQAFRAALADAYIDYFDQAPDEVVDDPRLLASGFAVMVRESNSGSPVDTGLEGVAELLRDLENLGLTRFEYERAVQAVLAVFTPDPDMTPEEFRIVVEWYKSRLADGAAPAAAAPSDAGEGTS